MAQLLGGVGPYSLSGVRLDGDRLVHLVYVDEAGISNKQQEPYLVVAGVLIDGDSIVNGVRKQLERILLRHIPARLRDRDGGFVFHATEFFNGGKDIKRKHHDAIGPDEWPYDRRMAVVEEIMEIPRKFKLPVAIGFVERAGFPSEDHVWPDGFPESEKTIAAHVATYMNCAMIVEQWMRKETKNENCLIIAENNDDAKHLITEVQRYHQDKKIDSVLDNESKIFFPLRKIQEDPSFQTKRPSNPLIVADFCAYVFKRVLMKDKRMKRFLDQIRGQLVYFDESWLDAQRQKAAKRDKRSAIVSAQQSS